MIEDSLVLSILASGVAHCQTVATEHGGLLSSLFAAGLFGSFTHCVGMCGPFVLSQTMTRLEAVPAAQMREFHRLAGAALIPYHLGRMTTYISLGMILSALADGMIAASGMKWLSAALLILAALFFTGYGLRKLNVTFPWKIGSWAGPSPRWLASITRPLFQRPVGWKVRARDRTGVLALRSALWSLGRVGGERQRGGRRIGHAGVRSGDDPGTDRRGCRRTHGGRALARCDSHDPPLTDDPQCNGADVLRLAHCCLDLTRGHECKKGHPHNPASGGAASS